MGERNMKRRRYSRSLLTPRERTIARLEQLIRTDIQTKHLTADERLKARSLMRAYLDYHDLTPPQWRLVTSIVNLHAKMGAIRSSSEWMVYAMRAGENVKVGYTSNVGARVKHIQTSHPDRVEIVWSLPCQDRVEAKRQEKKIHRLCSAFHVRGEWFQADVVSVLRSFRPREAA
jgi:hypothetical protein